MDQAEKGKKGEGSPVPTMREEERGKRRNGGNLANPIFKGKKGRESPCRFHHLGQEK